LRAERLLLALEGIGRMISGEGGDKEKWHFDFDGG
jgi:hypothetical protein